MRQAGLVRATGVGRRLLAVAVLLTAAAALSGSTQPSAGRHLTVAPPDSRSARSPGPPLDVVALGDSVPAGRRCGCTPFPVRYAASLAAQSGCRVAVSNDGTPGLTSTDLTAELRDGGPVAADVASADIVSITIGANDFDYTQASPSCPGGTAGCFDSQLVELSRQLDSVLTRIVVLRHHAPTTVLLTGYWDIWEDGQVAAAAGPRHVTMGDLLTRRVNQRLQHAAAFRRATYVDLARAFRGAALRDDDTGLLADDGDHPNATGHQVIADALFQATPPAAVATGTASRSVSAARS